MMFAKLLLPALVAAGLALGATTTQEIGAAPADSPTAVDSDSGSDSDSESDRGGGSAPF
ncbi:MAG: hypothetical protein ACYS22_03195 [Planctomycetota bacterium]|jgi:hypothetical protein